MLFPTTTNKLKKSSIVKSLVYIWQVKKIWHKPKKAKVLIYDRFSSEFFLEYIDRSDVEIVDVRRNVCGESVNIYVIINCILSLKFSRSSYISKYISLVKPAVAITFVDENAAFYRLKNSYPNLITISVQNGNRGDKDILNRLNKGNYSYGYFSVDHLLTFGSAIGNQYHQYIKGEIVPIGSLKNNLCRSVGSYARNTILFISEFEKKHAGFTCADGSNIPWEDFFSAEHKVLGFLMSYCIRKGLLLQVCGRTAGFDGSEYAYYRDLLGDKGWQFVPHGEEIYGTSSYHFVDSAEFVVFIGSTLGFESLARGKKTAAFCIRGNAFNMKFGWPANLPDNGPFWTNYADECEFERVLDYLTTVDDGDWEQTRQQYIPQLMEYDPGNTRFISLMQLLAVSLNENVR
jgi:surface carbohydrate biosynthesis protein